MPNDCDTVLINAAHDTFSVERTIYTKVSFEQWFFSDEFESLFRRSRGEVGITVPLERVPVTFGGENETETAWEMRRRQENRTKWDFSQLTTQKVFAKIVRREALDEWAKCIWAQAALDLVQVEINPTPDDVMVTIRVRLVEGLRPYEFTGLVVGKGLAWTDADDDRLRATPPNAQGVTVRIPWSSPDADFSFVVVNTNNGASPAVGVARPGKTAQVRYSIPEQTMTKLDRRSATTVTQNRHDDDGPGDPRSDDRKWRATAHTVRLTVDSAGQELRNASFDRLSGPSTHYRTDGPTFGPGSTYVDATIVAWTHPITMQLSADLWGPTVAHVAAPAKTVNIAGDGTILVTVPSNAVDGTLTISKGGAVINVSLGTTPSDRSVVLIQSKESGGLKEFVYDVTP